MQKFVGKTIWIIGATDGIGKAVLKKLDNSIQADFIISARSLDKLQNIAANLKNTAHVLSFDVADFAEFEKVAASALNYKPDFIIYFPAFYEPSLIADIAIANLNKTIP